MTGRSQVYVWMIPLILISWLSIVLLDPDPGIGGNEYRLGYFLGSLFGHATLAAAWTALGPGKLAWRVPLSIGWVLSLPLTIAVVVNVHGGPDDAWLIVGGCLLLQWLLLQVPLWAMVFGLRLWLRHQGDMKDRSSPEQMRFGIRHLLIVMTIVGVLLGLGRVIITSIDLGGLSGEMPIFVFLAIAAILLTLPLLLAMLMPRLAIPGVLLSIVFVGLATAFELPLLNQLGASGPGPGIEDFIAINSTSATLVLLSAFIVRLNGYRLSVRPRGALPNDCDS